MWQLDVFFDASILVLPYIKTLSRHPPVHEPLRVSCHRRLESTEDILDTTQHLFSMHCYHERTRSTSTPHLFVNTESMEQPIMAFIGDVQ